MSNPPDQPFAESFGDIPDPLSPPKAPVPPLRLPELDASPERAQVRTRRIAALVGSFAWLVVHLTVLGIRRDLGALPPLYSLAQIFLPFVVAVLSLFVALGSGKLGLGMKVGWVSALAILGPASFVLIAFGAPVPGEVPAGVATLLGIFVCFDITVAWAGVPLLLAALTLRGAFAASAVWRSALVGAGAGLFAGATMNLHCPNVAPMHMLFGHGFPVILATLAGAWLLVSRARA